MRVFAVAIDGPIAEYGYGVDYTLKKIYKIQEWQKETDFSYKTWSERFDRSSAEIAKHIADMREDSEFWMRLPCRDHVAIEMNKWSLNGLVPSILCNRNREFRLQGELWLSQNHVPYSNLLFNVSDPMLPIFLKSIDASFYIEENIIRALRAAGAGVKTYILKSVYNEADLMDLPKLVKNYMLLDGMLTVVDKIEDITRLEGVGKISG